MSSIYCYVLIFLFFGNTKADENNKQNVFITVYYESNCIDSKRFVMRQLIPMYELLHKYVDIEFIPFGKAYSINETAFECQHGPSECLGNLVQACTLKLIKGRADYKRILSYVACELNTKAGTRNNMQCVGKSGANVRSVRNCVRNGDGIKLMKSHERATDFINPQFIPTMTFDGSFDQFIQDLALSDLIRAVCFHFNYSVKECQ